jgi:hypothetical protein
VVSDFFTFLVRQRALNRERLLRIIYLYKATYEQNLRTAKNHGMKLAVNETITFDQLNNLATSECTGPGQGMEHGRQFGRFAV